MILRTASFHLPIARGLAMFLGLFTLLNIAGSHRAVGFDANIWWIDLGFLPHVVASISLTMAAVMLICFAAGFPDHPATRRLVAFAVSAMMAETLGNAFTFYRQWFIGRIHPGIPTPLSFFISVSLGFILIASFQPWKLITHRRQITFAITFAASLVLFPLAQMYCFGKTDYRRPADAIVVFGARTYADGTPSPALSDRTRTAIKLYQQHLAPELIFSGGPGDGAISEPQAMRTMALSMGVPASAIILDEHGFTTEWTGNNTVPIFEKQHLQTVLAVSHSYHLARVKMAYVRALSADHSGVQLLTVPAEESAPLPRMPWYMTREIAALWMYYLRPLI